MRVVIAEANYIGHYYTYVRRVLESVREITADVTLLVSPDGLRSKEFETNLRPALRGENVIDCLRIPRRGMFKGSLDMVNNMRDAVRKTKADHLLVPSADNVAQAVGMAGLMLYRPFPRTVETEGLLTVLSFTYQGAVRTVPAGLITRALQRSPFNRIHLIDLLALQWLKNRMPKLAERFSVIPDPVENFEQISKATARRILGLPEEGRLMVCPGILIYRKGIGLLLNAFLESKVTPTDRILLAGPVGDDVAATLKDPRFQALIKSGRVQIIDKYLSAEELGQVMCAGDITVCPYPQQWHPSSIAIKSLACDRPVLGADSFWLGQMIPAFKMGWTANVNDPESLARGVEQAFEESGSWMQSDSARKLVEFQSIDRFRDCWTKRIRQRMGLDESIPEFDVESLIQNAGLESYGRNQT